MLWFFTFELPGRFIPKEDAYHIISDELMLDANPRLNLTSFITTWMEPECEKLIITTIMHEHPITTMLEVCEVTIIIYEHTNKFHISTKVFRYNIPLFNFR